MPRVKRGKTHLKKRKKLLKQAKGYKWGRKKSIKLAKTAVTKAGAHAYKDRKIKKRTMRRLWQVNLNAFLRQNDWTYSKFIGAIKKNKIEIDRKVLADLAKNNPDVLKAILKKLSK